MLMNKNFIPLYTSHIFFYAGMTKKIGMLKIVHDKYKTPRKDNDPVITDFLHSFEASKENNKELESLLSKTQVRVH